MQYLTWLALYLETVNKKKIETELLELKVSYI